MKISTQHKHTHIKLQPQTKHTYILLFPMACKHAKMRKNSLRVVTTTDKHIEYAGSSKRSM